ncbi:DUF732 domain-containing protein [Mycolicibacterium fallax]|uniref:Uncharacterized protein n=1 Tax=Mycolicibacterium fallax TaxID=1793 RepID=A0A1X1RDL5_MYCFA|nr:DUF732 domain-containing protein [Mycolicibacterium fallax]ORV03504.1 hypothetical protein AWC04_10370 [Mycolicibacterium fallax]BBY97417.1 hypothetical protein MFAL_08840 [Mycolicibacterium fallax]HSA39728.1 DUF732 domain-containing protein [Mycobacterium sp.]
MKLLGITTVALTAAAIGFAAPANAEIDTDFANTLHTYGIYGQRDYNAWIAKIACKRLRIGQDKDAYQSAAFIGKQLDRTTQTDQVWKFLGLTVDTYCPDQQPVLARAAEQH